MIDDESIARSVTIAQLRSAGIAEACSATDWESARRLLESDKDFDLVVTDLDMPGAKGAAFLEDLARLLPGVGVLVVSALEPVVLGAIRKLALKSNVLLLGVLQKPLSVENLRTLLQPPGPSAD